MKIKYQGFELNLEGGAINWDDYRKALLGTCGQKIRYGAFNRMLYLDHEKNPDFTLGLFISIKDQRKFTSIMQSGGSFHLKSHDLDDAEQMADFNFFVLHKESHRGLYQYYHHSCSLRQFLNYLEKKFFELRKNRFDEAQDKASGDEEHMKMVDALKKTSLQGNPLVSFKDFEDLVNQLDTIKEMRFEVATEKEIRNPFIPLAGVSKRKTERYLFTPGMAGKIKQAIFKVRNEADGVKGLRVDGAENGVEKVVQLFENLEDFGSREYDDVVDSLNVDLEDFSNAEIFSDLLDVVATKKNHFAPKRK